MTPLVFNPPENSVTDSLAKRMLYTPDYLKLKNNRLHLVFLPFKIAEKIVKKEMFAGDRVRYLGKGITTGSSFALKSDLFGVSKDYLLFDDNEKTDHNKPRRVKGRVFAMTPRQISVIDKIMSVKESYRKRVVIGLMDQRKNNLFPIKAVYSWFNVKESFDNYHRLPTSVSSIIEYRGTKELVFDP